MTHRFGIMVESVRKVVICDCVIENAAKIDYGGIHPIKVSHICQSQRERER